MMGMALEFIRDRLLQPALHGQNICPRRQARAVGDPEEMRINGNGGAP